MHLQMDGPFFCPFNAWSGNPLFLHVEVSSELARKTRTTLAHLLGHSSIDCTHRYVDVDQDVLSEMFANAI